MQEIIPYVSCVVSPSEFAEALNSHYSEIYVKQHEGYMKHVKLRGDRFVRLKVDQAPKGYTPPVEERVVEELNFLPAGKIPFEYFEQIKCFFKEVMNLKKADYEAHAWILWNEEKGYYISVPKQTVSKASVSFTYDEDALPKDSIIVVDLHSHNTMGAFYSGTDNNNDRNGIYYSGVIGKLNTNNPEVVMRFNMLDVKRPTKLDEIFEIAKNEVLIPKAWLDQVHVAAPITLPPLGSGRTGSLWDDKNISYGGTYDPAKYRNAYRRGGQAPAAGGTGSGYVDPDVARLLAAQEEALEEEAIRQNFGIEPRAGEVSGSSPFLFNDDDDDEDEDAEKGGKKKAANGEKVDEYTIVHGEDYDANAVMHGVKAADAADLIAAVLDDLADSDELLLDVIRDAFELLSEEGQAKIQTNGL